MNKKFTYSTLALAMTIALNAQAQEQDDNAQKKEKDVEKISVVGTQIRGGQVSEALAVSVFDENFIADLGVDSGDELMDLIPENGQNFFNEAENIAGGVNAARGDIGAFNLRNLGTGNTLVLLNGRRLVNAASYQTEEVGGSFVPVNSVNSNTIPVGGLKRLEVLRDGASAIYGADAVAGVVNHVLKNDFEGLNISYKYSDFGDLPRNDHTITVDFGQSFNDGKTNVSAFFNHYDRGRVSSLDDPRWSSSDFRDRIPEDSPWAGSTAFRNDSVNSLFGQFDAVASAASSGIRDFITDRSGEFETYPIGDSRCEFTINETTCGAPDGQGAYRFDFNAAGRDLVSELQRTNLFVFINHELENGMESFSEISYYTSDTNLIRHPSASFSTSKLRVAAENYYNPLGPVGSPNRLPDSVIGPDVPEGGMDLIIDNYRFAEYPRIVDNEGTTYRFLTGLRGFYDEWDWESAVSYSKATRDDITRNRVSNTLMQEALNDPTPAAYNPFSGGVNSNIERALIDVTRLAETTLTTFDFKAFRGDLFELPGGDAGVLLGIDWRRETFEDDRDPRLDGTIVFTDWEGDTYPYVSDVVNSSPTPDNSGSRNVTALYAEFQLPLLENLDVQLASRYEDFSDVGSTFVNKLAFGYRPSDMFLLRGSISEAFRAPNLVTINEEIVARNNQRTDWTCVYAAENGGDPGQDILDCRNSTQRIAEGSKDLEPEESVNTSLGFSFTPNDNITITVDYWSIEKENTIGLFGEENHTLLDLVTRLQGSVDNCDTNPAVNRQAPDDDQIAVYTAAGLCPAGDIAFINDRYMNLDNRTLEGVDLGFYFNAELFGGDLDASFNMAKLDTFEQDAGGDAQVLVDAVESGVLPPSYPIEGFADLINKDGNQDYRYNFRVAYRKGDWGGSITGNKVSGFYQSSLTLDDGTRYMIPSVNTYNATLDYRFDLGDNRARIRFGIRNLTDKRAPLADRYFGYFADAHRDIGRNYYVSFKAFL